MADRYANFSELEASEPPESYRIVDRDTGSPVVIAAPHGGGIEPGTSEVALAIAGNDLSHYLFEGQLATDNQRLHITSSNFDEARCLRLLEGAEVVITVHGEGADGEIVYIGGLHDALRDSIRKSLAARNFTTREHPEASMQGRHKRNICNISRNSGVQLELSNGLRRTFFASLSQGGRRQSTPRLEEFSAGVREGLSSGSNYALERPNER